jgi:hypothetical protein
MTFIESLSNHSRHRVKNDLGVRWRFERDRIARRPVRPAHGDSQQVVPAQELREPRNPAVVPGFLERFAHPHLGQCANHGFFGLGELHHQAVLTTEASEVAASQGPDFFNHGGARSGQADDLASLQVGQFTNTVYIGRFQGNPQRRLRASPNSMIIVDLNSTGNVTCCLAALPFRGTFYPAVPGLCRCHSSFPFHRSSI